MLELEFLRGKAVAAAAELAEVFAILQAKSEKGLTKNSLACEKPNHSNRNRRTRTASSELSEREKQVWATIHIQGKTIAQAAIEFSCTPQNISKHHKNAERKMNAKKSRSANTSYRLPEDDRGQISLG